MPVKNIDRENSLKNGLRYYEGLPCIHCAGTKRYVNGGGCVYCAINRPTEAKKKARLKYEKSGKFKIALAKRNARYNAGTGRNTKLLKKYGITTEQYEQILQDQDHKCGICGLHENESSCRLAVDHCHERNKVRGLLCSNCNTGLGLFKDSVEFLNKALEYVYKHT
jgi:Recombination endonuclease VII